jgi:hypothetical protein
MARYKPKSTFYYSHHLIRQQNGTKLRAGRRQRKRRVARRQGNPGLQRPVRVDAALAAIIGTQEASRAQINSLLWKYVRTNKLQVPHNGRRIVPDATLATVVGVEGEEMDGFTMMKYVKPHILKSQTFTFELFLNPPNDTPVAWKFSPDQEKEEKKEEKKAADWGPGYILGGKIPGIPDEPKIEEICNKKSIGDSYYAVKVIITDGVPGEKEIDTNMDEDELQEFQEKWNSLKHSYLDDSDDDN